MGGSARITVAAAAAASVMGSATAGWGQAMSPMVYNGFIGGSAVAPAGRWSRKLNGLGPDGRPLSAATTARRAVSTRYNRNPAVTQRVQAQFADYVAKVAGPQKAQVVRTELGKRDFVQAWTTLAGPDGYRPAGAAEAMAAYWVLNWAMANRQDPSPRQSAGARAQLHANLPYNPAFASFPESKRQERAETLMINYIYQQGLYADALKSGDRVMQRRLSDAVEARFQNEMHGSAESRAYRAWSGAEGMKMRSSVLSLAAVIAVSWSAAHAQSTFQPNWSAWGSANLGMNVLGRQQALIHGRNPDAPPKSLRRVALPTTYRQDPAVTRRVVDAFAGYVARVSDPGNAQAVRDQLGRADVEREWLRLTGPDGFHAGDAGDALASYWMLNWVIANKGDSNARQAAGARAQLRVILPANPAFARLSEAQRQEMAETYMVNFLYQQGSYTDALRRNDTTSQQRLSDAAEARFQNELRIDLRSLTLTDRGFVKRG